MQAAADECSRNQMWRSRNQMWRRHNHMWRSHNPKRRRCTAELHSGAAAQLCSRKLMYKGTALADRVCSCRYLLWSAARAA